MREPVSSPFTSFLAQHFDQINDYLATFFDGQATSADIERYLYTPLSTFTANAGKRHRPLICMLAATAVGGSFESARSAAAAIEHFQSGALIHDDIADNGQLRRGKPCMHLTEGTGLAINCGDLALTMVTKTVLDDPTLEPNVKLRVLHELTEMIVRTIEGQALDLGWVRDGRFDISVDDYLDMATHKTAYYSGATPLATGAIIGGGSEEQIEALRAFAAETAFERLGVFPYSREEGTPAALLPDQLDEQVKADRAQAIMKDQMAVSDRFAQSQIGKTLPVLVDDFDVVSEAYYGRSYMDAPDIDPKIYFTGKPGIKPGQIVNVKIEEVIDYDLIGTVV